MRSDEFRRFRVFTHGGRGGTAVAVYADADGLSQDQMQRLATERDAPTTAFVQRARRPECAARVRVFSPRRELPLEVAPVLAVARALNLPHGASLELGVIAVGASRVDEDRGEMRMPRTVLGTIPIEDREAVGSVFGLGHDAMDASLPILTATGGVGALLVPVGSLDALRRAALRVDLWPLLIEKARVLGVMLYVAPTDGAAVRCRMFAPGAGVAEDLATGSAAAPLAMLLEAHERTSGAVRFHQGLDSREVSEMVVQANVGPNGSGTPSVSGLIYTENG